MSHVATFNALHLGDNLVHLHFLRKMAQRYRDVQFTHGASDHYLAQLYPLWQDLPNLTVKSIAEVGQGAINAWRGVGGHWYAHPQRNDFVAYHLDWFRHLARMMGLESPIHCASDLLFDYPALHAPSGDGGIPQILVVNSPPLSGQWHNFSNAAFDFLILKLYEAGHAVVTTSPSLIAAIPCTRDHNMDVTAIGRQSQRARAIIGCVTGPMWPCLNVWNAETVQLRVHLLDQERVDYLPARTVHCNSLQLVPEILKERGLI